MTREADAETHDDLARADRDAPTDVEDVRQRGRDALLRLLADPDPHEGPTRAPGAPPAAGDRLGGAVLVEVLGRGGMGVVWRAHDPALGRDVAVKVLRQVRDEADLARFRAEGAAAARLRHPHVLRVHSADEHRGWPFLVLDLVEGESLADRLDRTGALPPRAAAELARALASALAHAHARGLVHRDVKPANVLLDAAGTPLLADFGLARDLLHDARLTPTGAVVGTPAYMAPEQLAGRTVDARADVWALGVTLHELLCGTTPFAGLDGPPLLLAMERGPARTGVDRGLDAVVATCLAFEPGERYPTASDLEADLAGWLAGRAPRPRGRRARRRVAALLAAALLPLGLAVALAPGGPRSPEAGTAIAPVETRPADPGPARDEEPAAAARRELRRARGLGPAARRAALAAWLERHGASAPPDLAREARELAGARALDPREACEALEAEAEGGPAADLQAVAAALAAPRGFEELGYVARARALIDRLLELRVARAVASDDGDVDARLAAHERAARLLGLPLEARERLADARAGALRDGRGERLRLAVEARDDRRIRALVAGVARTARVEPALDATRRVALARALRAAVWRGAPPAGRGAPSHAARVTLEDALFYDLAPEAPLGEGTEWSRAVELAFLEDGVSAAEGLALLRGHRGDSWADVQTIARATAGDTQELARRGAAGSAAARLLRLLRDLLFTSAPEALRDRIPALRAVRDAPIADLPPGLVAGAHLRLAEALLDTAGEPAEVEALARRALAALEALEAQDGVVTERLSTALVLLLRARTRDVAALTAAAREALAVLERHERVAPADPGRGSTLRLARAAVLAEHAALLEDRCPDPEGLAWVERAEAAAVAGGAGRYLQAALQRRTHRLEGHLAASRPRDALAEAHACWSALQPALAARASADEASAELREAIRALARAAARAAEQAGDDGEGPRWRAVGEAF